MKKVALVFLSCICILTACSVENTQGEENKRHFIEWNSYLGYSIYEEPVLDLTYILSNNNSENDINEVVLISNHGEIKATSFDIFKGSAGNGYVLMTLSVKLHSLKEGTYHVKSAKIQENGGKTTLYNIGNWIIDVKGNLASEISYKKCSYSSACFENYYSEIVNESKSTIAILGLFFSLENKSPQIVITESGGLEESAALGTQTIDPGQMKFFNFQFTDAAGNLLSTEFIALKPFLFYEKDGEKFYAPMNTTIYSPTYTESDIQKILWQ